jgi:hypothetical protein
MDDLESTISSLDGPVTLWIAGSIAAIFILVVVVDSIRRRRARKSGHPQLVSAEARSKPGVFKGITRAIQQFKKELARRRRHKERYRDREKRF